MTSSLLYERAEEFVSYKVGEYFKLSWVEFMDLSHEQCNMLIDISKKRLTADTNTVNAIANTFNNMESPKK